MSKWTVMSLFLSGTGMALIGTLLLTHAQVREILEPFAHERSMSGVCSITGCSETIARIVAHFVGRMMHFSFRPAAGLVSLNGSVVGSFERIHGRTVQIVRTQARDLVHVGIEHADGGRVLTPSRRIPDRAVLRNLYLRRVRGLLRFRVPRKRRVSRIELP